VSEQAGIDLHSSNLAASNPFKKGLPQKATGPDFARACRTSFAD
jgi:hypothetical protein